MNFYDDLQTYGDAIAVIDQERGPLSYARLAQRADALGAHAAPGGVKSLVFCLCDNNLESLTGYLGLLRARAVPLLLNAGIHPDLYDKLLAAYRPAFAWHPRGHAAGRGREVFADGDYVLTETGFGTATRLHPDLALLLTTSGSTGSPRLVRLSYANVASNAASIAGYLGIAAHERPITTLPMNYSYGLSIVNSHLLRGATLLLTKRTLMDKAFWEFLRTQQATSMGGVPYVYEMLKRLRFARMDLPSLRTLTQAGGRLSVDLTREFAALCADKNMRFFVMYGQTEATARMSYLPPELAVEKAGSIGIAIPGGSFALENAGPDGSGELVYRGPNVSLGYADDAADLARGDDNGGVLHTGDVARRDADGLYTIVGRMKRMLKLFGNRINLEDIERMVAELGYDCACAGEDDRLRIHTTDADPARHAAVRAFVAERTGINASAFSVHHIAAIPRNDAGKILYSALPA
jgi:acyl-CoA synthetase (AMP-forming)/AMP-acid ligase II